MACDVIRMDEGTRREAKTLEDSVNEQDNGTTVDVTNFPKGTISINKKRRLPAR